MLSDSFLHSTLQIVPQLKQSFSSASTRLHDSDLPLPLLDFSFFHCISQLLLYNKPTQRLKTTQQFFLTILSVIWSNQIFFFHVMLARICYTAVFTRNSAETGTSKLASFTSLDVMSGTGYLICDDWNQLRLAEPFFPSAYQAWWSRPLR